MAHTHSIRQRIHDYIVSNILFDNGDVEDNASLMGEGILDSTGVLEMVLFVEESFGVTVPEDEVVPEHFDSVNALAAFVEDKQSLARHKLAS